MWPYQCPTTTQQITPKLMSLKHNTFNIAQFLWVRSPGTAGLGPPNWGLTKLPSGSGCGLIRDWTGDGSTSKLTWLWAEFSTSCALGLRVSVFMLAVGRRLHHGAGPSKGNSQCGHCKASKGGRVPLLDDVPVLRNVVTHTLSATEVGPQAVMNTRRRGSCPRGPTHHVGHGSHRWSCPQFVDAGEARRVKDSPKASTALWVTITWDVVQLNRHIHG